MATSGSARSSPSSGEGLIIRVLVADDQPVVRAGLKEILARQHDIRVLGEAETSGEVCRLVAQKPWDVVVLALSLTSVGGLQVLREIRRERPQLAILVLTDHPEDQLAVRALRAGAAGYISTKAAPEELVRAIRRLAQGRRYVSDSVAEELIRTLGDGFDGAPHERLSSREFQVLRLLGTGRSAGQIATDLRLSIKTISTYRTRILEKMGMHSSAQLVHYVLQQRLAEG